MKNIELNKLELKFFKGAKETEINFNHYTTIFGDNGTGKSTVADAFSWLLFGKNVIGESDTKFNIKTLDSNNNVIQKVEHSVEGWLTIGGVEVNPKRVLREKWVKKRGSENYEFNGNETVYFWNDVPLSKKEYDQEVSNILDETVFKLITDPLAFNNLHWEKSRGILIGIAGDVSNEDVAKGDKRFEQLLSKLVGKDLERYQKELAAKRLKLNKEISLIPSRIDEVNKSKPENLDFESIEKEKSIIETEIQSIDSKIEDRNKLIDEAAKSRANKSNEIFSLKSKNQNISFEVKKQISDNVSTPDNTLDNLKSDLLSKNTDIDKYNGILNDCISEKTKFQNKLSEAENKLSELRQDFDKENKRELKFDDNSFSCPTCKKPLDESDIESEKEKMTKEFNEDKEKSLLDINRRGKNLSEETKSIQKSIEDLDIRIKKGREVVGTLSDEASGIESKIKSFKSEPVESVNIDEELKKALSTHKEYQNNLTQIETLEKEVEKEVTVDVSDLKVKKEELSRSAKDIEIKLSKKQLIENADARIKELSNQESEYAQQIADIEREQFLAQDFTVKKVEALEAKINSMFTGVQFKMYKEQVDGLKPWCYCLVDGVPFSDVNTAGKVNAGISIINVLCNHYNVTAPIFIDNRESVVELIDTDSQIINLVVSEKDKVLRVV